MKLVPDEWFLSQSEGVFCSSTYRVAWPLALLAYYMQLGQMNLWTEHPHEQPLDAVTVSGSWDNGN